MSQKIISTLIIKNFFDQQSNKNFTGGGDKTPTMIKYN